MPDYSSLPTEQPHPERPELDRMESEAIARLLLGEERQALAAVDAALPAIATVCGWASDALRAGGRLIYVGAGTSGRLGVLDAAEMGPTFGAEPGRVVGLIAGGARAVTEAVEGAEDDYDAGARACAELEPTEKDLVLGISMSGTAAFVTGALETAEGRTALITANPDAAAPFKIVLALGGEALAGSTRLKGGSATKTVLNMISTAGMAGSGAVYGPWMVRVRPTNRKLRDRAERMVTTLTDLDPATAADLLRDAGDDVRVAVLMARLGLDANDARQRLEEHAGRLREALE